LLNAAYFQSCQLILGLRPNSHHYHVSNQHAHIVGREAQFKLLPFYQTTFVTGVETWVESLLQRPNDGITQSHASSIVLQLITRIQPHLLLHVNIHHHIWARLHLHPRPNSCCAWIV